MPGPEVKIKLQKIMPEASRGKLGSQAVAEQRGQPSNGLRLDIATPQVGKEIFQDQRPAGALHAVQTRRHTDGNTGSYDPDLQVNTKPSEIRMGTQYGTPTENGGSKVDSGEEF